MQYNQRKTELLELLDGGGSWTSREVADHLGMSLSAASHALRRLWKQGLLSRHQVPTPGVRAFGYQIADRGRDRLAQFNLEAEELEGMEAPTFQEHW